MIDDELRDWWAQYHARCLRALRHCLGLKPKELFARLGITYPSDLKLPAPPERKQARRRGRPRRGLNRDSVIVAIQETRGNVRAAARRSGVPRTTLQEYLAREPIPAYVFAYGRMRSEHCALLHGSGVSPEVVWARGYASGPDGLVVPIWSAKGKKIWAQVRVDSPRKRRDRYRNERGAVAMVDVSPYARVRVLDHDCTLYVSESPRKADAAVSLGLACVAVQGARLISFDRDEWNYIGVEGRDVVIAFDGDASTNDEVRQQERNLWEFLTELGANVRVAALPSKMGLDDYLAAGHSLAELEDRVAGYSAARATGGQQYPATAPPRGAGERRSPAKERRAAAEVESKGR